ncbi:MAG: hypothetical protein AABY22_35700, partial [Nanoarchaeota archaeon]
SWLIKVESLSGPCLVGLNENYALKDYDKDDVYEIMHKNNIIGKELQESLGWIDVDGDGISEIEDPNPYGRYEVNKDYYCPLQCYQEDNRQCSCYSDSGIIRQ